MTFNTHRNNLKGLGIVWVMILPCLFAALTFKGIWTRQFTCFDSVIDDITSFDFFRKTVAVPSPPSFTFFALLVALANLFKFFTLVICFTAFFASALRPVFSTAISVKFRKRFCLIAIPAFLCYDSLRHVLFLVKRLCLGPVSSYTLDVGSFHINNFRGDCKC